MYASLARWSFRHPWRVIGGWVAILVALGLVTSSLGPAYDSSFEIPDSESSDGFDILDAHFGGVGSGTTGSIVFSAEQGVDDPEVEAALTSLFDVIRADENFEGLSLQSPYEPGNERLIARQGEQAGQIAYADITMSFDIDETEASELGRDIEALIEDQGIDEIEGLRVELGGAALGVFEPPESELLGLAFAVFVLILAMGSVVAMGTTIGVAVLGVGIGAILITLLSNVFTVPDFATTIGLMIGLGVGIDYALFIVTRYREALHQGFTPENGVAVALDTAGRAVIFAGLTVVVSLLGMLLIGLSFISGLGIGAAVTVSVVMAASVTALPAALGIVADQIETTTWRGIAASSLIALGLLGAGIGVQFLLVGFPLAVVTLLAGLAAFESNPLRRRLPPRRLVPIRETVWYRWSRSIQARPWVFAIGGTALLLVLASPLLDLRLGFSDEGNYSEETTTRQAYDMLADGFGPGSNGPLLVAVELGAPGEVAALDGLSQALGAADGVAFASPAQPNDPDAPTAAIIQVQPTTSPQDEATEQLVHNLRDDVIPRAVEGTSLDAKVTGLVAANIDFTSYLGARILLFFGAVLTLSFLLLMAVFRSLLVPLKAVVMNMLSIGAAYGIVVAVFQWGWGGAVFGIEGAPIEPFIPMMLFAIVFGLSMDYEVFLLSRVKEEYERTGDPVNSVADGLASTAQVITAAAAIMIVVFGSFVFEDNRIVKLFGLGLSTAVFIDASLVRMLLVPSTMQLLGARNWWLPGWLDRILPNLNVEGGDHEPSAIPGQ
ncbi:MAG: MMPL family transporter [Actinomycetia bacterium]|nr:MMPL family transporter [Actinomycetes bacterium]